MPAVASCPHCGMLNSTPGDYFLEMACHYCGAEFHEPTPDAYLYSSFVFDEPGVKEHWIKYRILKRTAKGIYIERWRHRSIVDRAKLEGGDGTCWVRSLHEFVYTYQAMLSRIARVAEKLRDRERFWQECAAQQEQARRAAEEQYRQHATQQAMAQAPRLVRCLAEYAGERLEWPCDVAALKRVWRLAARRTHPDTGGSPDAFRAAHESYTTVLKLVEVAQ
jgi:hypothetical protein